MKIAIAIVIAITIAITIESYAHYCVMYHVVSSLFSYQAYIKSQSIQRSTGSCDYTSRGLKIHYQNGIILARFVIPPKTKYMTFLKKNHLSKIKPCKKSNK